MMPPQGTPIAPQMPALMPPTATPQPAPLPVTHDVTIVTTKKRAQARVMGVPPEEFGIERGARSIRDCNYCFHEIVTKTVSQLIAEGYDEDQVNNLEDYTGNTEIETLARDTVGEHYNTVTATSNPGSRLVKLTEHYIRIDYLGNGKASLYQVVTAGTQGDILKKDGKESITPFDAIPFAATCPVPQPHRFFGRSIADLVMPTQREKTALKRGALDNLYLHNNPRVEVAEQTAGKDTLDDLLTSRPGGVIRTKTPGGLNWQSVPDITGSIWPAMQYLDAELEARTGVSKQTQGIDANALQNQSATAVAQVFSASQMRMKLIARVMAEGVRDIFSLLHATIRKHGQEAETVRLRNQWVDVDPREWKTRDHMTINVGLGTGGKAQQFAQTMAIGNVQKELLAGGKANLVGDAQLYNTAAELTRIMGHKNPDQFFNDPDAKGPNGLPLHPSVPPPPDPKTQAIQAQAQADAQAAQIQAQIDQQKAQSDAQLAQLKAQSDAQHQQLAAQSAAQLAQFKAQLDAKMMQMEAALQAHADQRAAALAEQKAQHAQQAHHQSMAADEQEHHQTTAAGALDLLAKAHAHDVKIEQMKTKPAKTEGEA
jgi:hypothetical protein